MSVEENKRLAEQDIPCNIYDFEKGRIKGVRKHFDSADFAEIAGD
jgi:hypothetical protein